MSLHRHYVLLVLSVKCNLGKVWVTEYWLDEISTSVSQKRLRSISEDFMDECLLRNLQNA